MAPTEHAASPCRGASLREVRTSAARRFANPNASRPDASAKYCDSASGGALHGTNPSTHEGSRPKLRRTLANSQT